jgi:hypothetical protein
MHYHVIILKQPAPLLCGMFALFCGAAFSSSLFLLFHIPIGFIFIPTSLVLFILLFRKYGREKVHIDVENDQLTIRNAEGNILFDLWIGDVERVYCSTIYQYTRSSARDFFIVLKSGGPVSFRFSDTLSVNHEQICDDINKFIRIRSLKEDIAASTH